MLLLRQVPSSKTMMMVGLSRRLYHRSRPCLATIGTTRPLSLAPSASSSATAATATAAMKIARPIPSLKVPYPVTACYADTRRFYFSSCMATAVSATCQTSASPSTSPASITLPQSFDSIEILYASQTGTAQIFAMQLLQTLENAGHNCSMKAMSELSPSSLLVNEGDPDQEKKLHLFVISTTGVGEFPINGKPFYDDLQKLKSSTECGSSNHNTNTAPHYAIFALGNSQAHPHHYCAAGKALDEALQQHLAAQAVMPITLGDDSKCLDDAFDQWQDEVVNYLKNGPAAAAVTDAAVESAAPAAAAAATTAAAAVVPFSRTPTHYPPLQLEAPPQDAWMQNAVPDLLDVTPNLYPAHCRQRLAVTANIDLRSNPVAYTGLHELHVELPPNMTYGTGDHLAVYPRNSDVLVQAYLEQVVLDMHQVNPYTIVTAPTDDKHRYPHPVGISVYQTLSHCVDLQAIPSPSLARWLLGRKEVDYMAEISEPRRTVLDLVLESGHKVSLTDLLYSLPPLQPRYYSIATSAAVHPHTIYLTYRPVHYVTKRGSLRHGLCTSYMERLKPPQSIMAGIINNPTFRLPTNPQTPVILIGGGCGVAPIRAFLEDLVHSTQTPTQSRIPYKNVYLFLGFRDPADEAYHELVQEASDKVLGLGHVGFASDGSLVTTAMLQHSATMRRLLMQEGAHVYICGGAASFGAAIRRTMTDVLYHVDEQHPNDPLRLTNAEAATQQLQLMASEGRWHEDLSD